MKKIVIRFCNDVDVTRCFSAGLRGGHPDIDNDVSIGLDAFSNDISPTVRTMADFTCIVRKKKPDLRPYLICGSLQPHAVISRVCDGGCCPSIGCTDFGLPKVVMVKNE